MIFRKYKYNPPQLIKSIFQDFQWNSINNKILLTFDDGPNKRTTEKILDVLDEFLIKTIFFCVGENLNKNIGLAKEIIGRGHEIGNHTQSHEKITRINKEELSNSIKTVQNFAMDNLDYNIKYFRPPYGRFNLKTGSILKRHNLKNVMWSLLTYDYNNDLNIVKFATRKYLNSNSIIVLHDSDKSKDIITDSIKVIVEEVKKKQYLIGNPSECLKYFS